MIRSLMEALNRVQRQTEERSLWRRYAVSIAYTIGLAALVIIAAGILLLGPRLGEWLASWLGLAAEFARVWTVVQYPIVLLLLIAVALLTYYAAPTRPLPVRRTVPGAAVAVVLWLAASLLFRLYVTNVARFGVVYGGLSAVIVLLVYFYLTSAILLLGAELNAQVAGGVPQPDANSDSYGTMES